MVITDELSNDTMLHQLRCKMNRGVTGRHAVKLGEKKSENKVFICGNHNILKYNKKRNKITYCKYKINSKPLTTGVMYWTFYNSVILFLLKINVYFVECELLCMTITIQVSKGWVSLTHIMADKGLISPEESTYFYQSTQYTHNPPYTII